MVEPNRTSYAAAGVDTDAAERLVSRFAALAKTGRRPEVLADVGPFAGLFRLGEYRDPVLVASTDSVGTKSSWRRFWASTRAWATTSLTIASTNPSRRDEVIEVTDALVNTGATWTT